MTTKSKSNEPPSAGDEPTADVPVDSEVTPVTTSPSDTPVPDADAPADPALEHPSEGGCYVRQADGSLKREDA